MKRHMLGAALLTLWVGCGGDETAPAWTTTSSSSTSPTTTGVLATSTGSAGVPTTGGTQAAASTGVSPGTTVGGAGSDAGADGDTGATTGTSGTSGDGGEVEPPSLSNVPPVPSCFEPPLARDVVVEELAVYQGVKVTIARAGVAVEPRNAPVVQGRDALVRAFVSASDGFRARTLVGTLTLSTDGVEETFTDQLMPDAPDDELLSSTFNFEVKGESLGPDTRYHFSIHEADCATADAADGEAPTTARFPAEGDAELAAMETGVLKVTVVPVRYGAGAREPDTTDEAIERYEQALLRMYPVTGVELKVREPLTWNQTVDARSDRGWSDLLDAVLALQQSEAEPGEYFFGLFMPTERIQEYCGRGCIAGLAPVPQTGGYFGNPRATGGLGLGYDDELSRSTLAHELGHAHGRFHSPCAEGGSVSGVDPEYPHDNANIGAWGYDILDGDLLPPDTPDVMSYCNPVWISDYTYAAIAEWVASVNGASPRLVARKQLPATPWHTLLVHPDGSARWATWQPEVPPGGTPTPARVLSADGEEIRQLEAWEMPLSEGRGAYVFVPQPEQDWATLELPGHRIELDQVED